MIFRAHDFHDRTLAEQFREIAKARFGWTFWHERKNALGEPVFRVVIFA